MIEINTIYNENCFETMARQTAFADLVVTSPPYNTGRCGTTDRAFNNYENRYDIHLDNQTDGEYIQWSVDLFRAYDTAIKANGCVLYNISYSSENTDLLWKVIAAIISQTPFTTADVIGWKKDSAIPNNVSPNKLTRIFEFVFVFARKAELSTFFMNKAVTSVATTGQSFYENKFNFIETRNNDESNPLNKATFSYQLVAWLIHLYAPVNAVIYDSFMGTGTTAVACVKERMNYVGSELSKAQCEYANLRLEPYLAQSSLF